MIVCICILSRTQNNPVCRIDQKKQKTPNYSLRLFWWRMTNDYKKEKSTVRFDWLINNCIMIFLKFDFVYLKKM